VTALHTPAGLRPVPTTADEWFARRRSPDRTQGEEAAFEAWLAADTSHASEYEECERFWRVPMRLKSQVDLASEALRLANLSSVGREVPRAWPGKWGVGAALAATVAAMAWYLAPIDMITPDTVKTARGEQRTVVLSDGSTVQLNTDSIFRAHVTDHERRVDLVRGEAFFDVAHDASRPFVVHVGSSEVRVVGTQFSVREVAGKLEVVVKEGVVNVVPDATRTVANADKVELLRGNRLDYDNSQRLVKVAAIDAERALLWRTGVIELDNEPLGEAVEEMNRYSSVPIVIEDPNLRNVRISGGFKTGDSEAFLYALKARFDVTVDRHSDRISLR